MVILILSVSSSYATSASASAAASHVNDWGTVVHHRTAPLRKPVDKSCMDWLQDLRDCPLTLDYVNN
jgi:hypothetical protein